jgi:hypothetical protein
MLFWLVVSAVAAYFEAWGIAIFGFGMFLYAKDGHNKYDY